MATLASPRQAERVDGGKVVGATLLGAAVAIVINVVIWALAQLVLNLNVQIPTQGPGSPLDTLSVVPVVVATLLPAIGAGALLWVLGRFTPRPYTIFLAIAVVFLLVSFYPSWALEISMSSKLVLSLMHIGAAVGIVWALLTRTRAA